MMLLGSAFLPALNVPSAARAPARAPAATMGEKAAPPAITEAEVLECRAKWAAAIASISKTYAEDGDFVGAAGEAAGELYGYGHHNVLFKPTKSTKNPFRPTGEEAMSYFVGAEAMNAPQFEGEDAASAHQGRQPLPPQA